MKKAKAKTYFLDRVTVNFEVYEYFYTREKCNVNGHPRYKFYIIDADSSAVHEVILTTYLTPAEAVKEFLQEVTNND